MSATFHARITPEAPLVDDLKGSYDPVAQLFTIEGDDVTGGLSGGRTQSWNQTNGGSDCSPLYNDDFNYKPWN